MDNIAMNNPIWTTNSKSLSKFEFFHFCHYFQISFDFCRHSLLRHLTRINTRSIIYFERFKFVLCKVVVDIIRFESGSILKWLSVCEPCCFCLYIERLHATSRKLYCCLKTKNGGHIDDQTNLLGIDFNFYTIIALCFSEQVLLLVTWQKALWLERPDGHFEAPRQHSVTSTHTHKKYTSRYALLYSQFIHFKSRACGGYKVSWLVLTHEFTVILCPDVF